VNNERFESQVDRCRDLEALGALLDARVKAIAPGLDRFNIGVLDLERYLFLDGYVRGRNVPGRATGHVRTLRGTVVEAALRDGGRTLQTHSGRREWVRCFPGFGPVYDSGIRSMGAVVAAAAAAPVANLVLASRDALGIDERALAVAGDLAVRSTPALAALAGQVAWPVL